MIAVISAVRGMLGYGYASRLRPRLRGDAEAIATVYLPAPLAETLEQRVLLSAPILVTDGTWKTIGTQPPASWNTSINFDDSGWVAATVTSSNFGPPGSNLIWDGPINGGPKTTWYRRTFALTGSVTDAQLVFRVDDDADVFVNGQQVINDHDHVAGGEEWVDVTSILHRGPNLIAVEAFDILPPVHGVAAVLSIAQFDLAAGQVSNLPISSQPGGALTPAMTITNDGPEMASGDEVTDFYLSPTPDLSASLPVLGTAGASIQLDPGQSIPQSASLTVPRDTPPGTYYLIAKINADGAIQESDSANDTNDIAVSTPIRVLGLIPSLHLFAVGVNWPDGTVQNGISYGGFYGGLGAQHFSNAISSLSNLVGGTAPVSLLADATSASNIDLIQTRFASFNSEITAESNGGQPDTALIYIGTHGGPGVLSVSTDGGTLTSFQLNQMLAALPEATNKIVILDACHSGSFSDALIGINNATLLAATTSDSTTPYLDTTVTHGDGTGVFTQALITAIHNGVRDVAGLAAYTTDSYLSGNSNLLNTQQFLEEDPGTIGIFTGLKPLIFSTSNLAGSFFGGARNGDANLDGKIDFSDLLILAQNFGRTDATFSEGDFDGDGTVDFADLLILAQNYGKSSAASADGVSLLSAKWQKQTARLRSVARS